MDNEKTSGAEDEILSFDTSKKVVETRAGTFNAAGVFGLSASDSSNRPESTTATPAAKNTPIIGG